MERRHFIKAAAASAALVISGCAATAGRGRGGRVAVVGGGYGGATAAKYIRMLDPTIEVVLIEPNEAFVSCPISNMVLGGFRTMADITTPYDALERRYGVRRVRDMATAIDLEKRQVRLARGEAVPFDRVIVSPGVDFMWEQLPALRSEDARTRIPHAWKAGPQTVALRSQLEAMPDGGVYVLSVPEAPYRCPPGPYERACQVAAYFKARKPRSKVLIVDANPDVTSKGALFKRAWKELFPGMVEFQGNSKAVDVDVASRTVKLEFGDVKADVLNVVPPQKAGAIAAPFITANGRWCEVDWLTFESKVAPGVHLLGDALQIAPAMPKSGSMANGHGKVCAAAVVALMRGEQPNPSPTLINTCYSMVSDKLAIHVTSVHKYETAKRTFLSVPGSGGVSSGLSDMEAANTMNWAHNIWADSLL